MLAESGQTIHWPAVFFKLVERLSDVATAKAVKWPERQDGGVLHLVLLNHPCKGRQDCGIAPGFRVRWNSIIGCSTKIAFLHVR